MFSALVLDIYDSALNRQTFFVKVIQGNSDMMDLDIN